MSESIPNNSIAAIRVRQWLAEWDKLDFDPQQNQAKPQPHFYLFSMPASQLRALSGIYRRSTDEVTPRKEDLGIQRRHDPDRSSEINRYVTGGYPWSDLSAAKRANPDNDKLKKPGWLPTAVVVNILTVGDVREGIELSAQDVVSVRDDPSNDFATLTLPELVEDSGRLPPIEVIDGQHRLFAFENDSEVGQEYYLPVVAFHGLDISWQAYLFWTINIKPKKINPSLAFDLYPLLREQEWLDSGEVVHVYRESRAQELTEALWATKDSPWFRRINMLGGNRRENGPVTQAAFIRSLVASMIKSWKPGKLPGGIFGGTPDSNEGLAWTRLQQAAFLLTAWKLLAESVRDSTAEWASSLRDQASELELMQDGSDADPAFAGSNSLLATDQGVRGFQYVVNDLCYLRHRELSLSSWKDTSGFIDIEAEAIAITAESLREQPVFAFLQSLTRSLADFDWRSSSAAGLSDGQKQSKAALRGSGGYRELRLRLISHLRDSSEADVMKAARALEI